MGSTRIKTSGGRGRGEEQRDQRDERRGKFLARSDTPVSDPALAKRPRQTTQRV